MHLLLLSLLACSGGDPKGDGDGVTDSGDGATDVGGDTDTDADTDTDGVTAGELHGTVPDAALPAPDFAARNRDGAARDREDLLGGPTVMWFYPKAATAG
ncbi:MAG: hypothetical protein H6742_15500 [Alphaproteobacteria bacterium]|nr:hypothetical protein [Alphaproteobacteria bacterium]